MSVFVRQRIDDTMTYPPSSAPTTYPSTTAAFPTRGQINDLLEPKKSIVVVVVDPFPEFMTTIIQTAYRLTN
jgi:hypothetical protein